MFPNSALLSLVLAITAAACFADPPQSAGDDRMEAIALEDTEDILLRALPENARSFIIVRDPVGSPIESEMSLSSLFRFDPALARESSNSLCDGRLSYVCTLPTQSPTSPLAACQMIILKKSVSKHVSDYLSRGTFVYRTFRGVMVREGLGVIKEIASPDNPSISERPYTVLYAASGKVLIASTHAELMKATIARITDKIKRPSKLVSPPQSQIWGQWRNSSPQTPKSDNQFNDPHAVFLSLRVNHGIAVLDYHSTAENVVEVFSDALDTYIGVPVVPKTTGKGSAAVQLDHADHAWLGILAIMGMVIYPL